MDSHASLLLAVYALALSVVVFFTRYLMPKSWIDERQIPLGVSGALFFAGVVGAITGLVLMSVGR